MRAIPALLAALALATRPTALAAEPPRPLGLVRAAGGVFDSPRSWLDGGFGKLGDSGGPHGERGARFAGEARLAVEWEPAVGWRLFVHGAARAGGPGAGSPGSGLLEAFAECRRGFGEGHEVVARLGQFFLPSSRENVEPLWSSPYTLTLSALNSWVAEEVRPIGLDLGWSRTLQSGQRIALAGTLFGGNDTAGTLVAWRGFAMHDRPTPTGRFLPLPRFPGRDERFPLQTRRGSRPFGSDLDGRPGLAGRLRWDAPAERAMVQASVWENRGDRALHGEEYAWQTGFRWLAVESDLFAGLRLVGEWGEGRSRMGFVPSTARAGAPPQVDVQFDLLYALLTREWGAWRATVRFDRFRVVDRDHLPLDDGSESGSAWTVALLARFGGRWRAGVELLDLVAERSATGPAGLGDAPTLDGRSLRVELRVDF